MKSVKDWLLTELKLPCWFVEDFRESKNNDHPVRKIAIYNDSNNEIIEDLLASPTEPCYIVARKLKEGEKYNDNINLQRDYGIFARMNKNNNQYIIIVGIHGYGTWIVAELLNNLLSNKKVDYESVFRQSKDFITIISGELNRKELTVNWKSIMVHNQYMWVKEGDKWIRKYRDDLRTHMICEDEERNMFNK